MGRFEQLFLELQEDAESRAVVERSRLRLLFEFETPGGSIAIDGRARPFVVERDPQDFPADLTLVMSCAIADRFFKGTLELGRALGAREIRSRGSLLRMLELRALLIRAQEIYRKLK